MSCEFFVVMVKRRDGKVYPDLHKTDGRIYLTRESAEAALNDEVYRLSKASYHVVRLVAEESDVTG